MRARCTGTSCASGWPPLLGTFRAFSYGSLYPDPASADRGRLDHRGASARRLRDGRRGRGGASGSTGSPPRARNTWPTCSPRSAPTPSTTRASEPDSRSSRRPAPTSGCRSSRVAAAGSRSSATASAARWPAPASGSTATRVQLHEHGLESVDREVRWLTELIEDERTDARYQDHHRAGPIPKVDPTEGARILAARSASASSASATAPRRWSRACTTTATPTRRRRSPA